MGLGHTSSYVSVDESRFDSLVSDISSDDISLSGVCSVVKSISSSSLESTWICISSSGYHMFLVDEIQCIAYGSPDIPTLMSCMFLYTVVSLPCRYSGELHALGLHNFTVSSF